MYYHRHHLPFRTLPPKCFLCVKDTAVWDDDGDDWATSSSFRRPLMMYTEMVANALSLVLLGILANVWQYLDLQV
jgi:hypothetical protein